MMKPNRQPPQEDKALRRSWLKLAVVAAAGILLMMAMPAIAMWAIHLPAKAPGASSLLGLALVPLVAIGVLALITYLMRWMMSDMKQGYDRSGEILQRTLPDLDIRQESATSEQFSTGKHFVRWVLLLPLFLLIAAACSLGIPAGLKLIWPDAPEWAQQAASLTVLIGGSLIVVRFINKRRLERDGIPIPSLKEDLGRLGRSLLFFLLFMPPLFWVVRQITALDIAPILIGPAALVTTTAAFGLLLFTYSIIPHLWITAAAKKGDYDRALRRIQIAEKLSTFPSTYLSMHGQLLLRAGRYAEAEQILHTGIVEGRKERSGANDAPALNILGYALMGQGKPEEAIKVFEGAVAMDPKQGAAYDSLAEAYLTQGIETERALELLDQALVGHQSSWLKRRMLRLSISETWAGRAWALARLGRRDEAAEALEKALAIAPHKDKANFAAILYRAGHALALLGETQKATESFEEAQHLDPKGRFGRLCAEAAAGLREGSLPSGGSSSC